MRESSVDDEVAEALELEARSGLGGREARLDPRGRSPSRASGLRCSRKSPSASSGCADGEQPVVEADLGRRATSPHDPVDHARRPCAPSAGLLPPRVAGMDGRTAARSTSPAASRHDLVAGDACSRSAAGPRGRARAAGSPSAGRRGSRRARCRVRERTAAGRAPGLPTSGGKYGASSARLALGPVREHDLERAQHAHHARRVPVEIVAHAELELAEVDDGVGLRDARSGRTKARIASGR